MTDHTITADRACIPPAAPLQDCGSSGGVLTVPEAAAILRCSKGHVFNLINGKVRGARPLPSLRLGRRLIVLKSSLNKWIEANERTGN